MRSYAIWCAAVPGSRGRLRTTGGRGFPANGEGNLPGLGEGVKLEMVLIPPGEFMMGSPDSDEDAYPPEKPQHRVRITKPFYLGKYLITQQQWEAVMGDNPSEVFKGPRNPVEDINWDDCQQFFGKLNAKFASRGGRFRLPTSPMGVCLPCGNHDEVLLWGRSSVLGEYAWYSANSDKKTHPVGEKKPNPWGLYDMYGNVGQWVPTGMIKTITRVRP